MAMAARMAIIATTIISSIKVKPADWRWRDMVDSPGVRQETSMFCTGMKTAACAASQIGAVPSRRPTDRLDAQSFPSPAKRGKVPKTDGGALDPAFAAGKHTLQFPDQVRGQALRTVSPAALGKLERLFTSAQCKDCFMDALLRSRIHRPRRWATNTASMISRPRNGIEYRGSACSVQ